MEVRKTVRIPVHYGTTKSKMDRLGRLTARLTYCISLINELVTIETKLDRPTLRKLVKNNDIAEKCGLSAGYIDQCIDKVIWAWRSYKDKYDEWKYRYDRAVEDLANCGDDERGKLEKKVKRLEKNEPSTPVFDHKVSCRLDYRTGRIERRELFLVVDAHQNIEERRDDGCAVEPFLLSYQAARRR